MFFDVLAILLFTVQRLQSDLFLGKALKKSKYMKTWNITYKICNRRKYVGKFGRKITSNVRCLKQSPKMPSQVCLC